MDLNAAPIITEIREKASLSQADLAILLSTSTVSISKWERGSSHPSPEQAEQIVALHRRVMGGEFVDGARGSISAFASRGARNSQSGQGILGTTLAKIPLSSVTHGPIFNRLVRGRVMGAKTEEDLARLINDHGSGAETVRQPPVLGMSAGKNTYTYDAHTYHTKVPPQAIAELLGHYLRSPGLVFDPFAGSGMTGVAASVLGHDCILNELSPAAAFIANRFTTALDPGAFEAAVHSVLSSLTGLRKKLYQTKCRECGRAAELLYTVWSYRVLCNRCGHEFLLWDVCRRYGRTVREHKILKEFPCPACGTNLKKSLLARTVAEPVQVGYKCCGSKQQEVTHTVDSEDVRLIRELDLAPPLAEGFYPRTPLPNGVNLRQPANHGLDSIDKFYTPRNLAAMSNIWQAIHRIESVEIAAHLAFVFTSLYQRVTRLSEFRFWGGSGNTAHFNVPFIFDEPNVFLAFERKARTIQDHLETTAATYKGRIVTVINSATSLGYIPTASVDLVFTDPPFGANINYSDMNFLWESWLGSFTDKTDEAIINRVQEKGLSEYQNLITLCLKECYRVLRAGHWLLLVFMNSSAGVWSALRNAVLDAGFTIEKVDTLDKQHGTFKQFVSENTAGLDLVLHCLKPVIPATRGTRIAQSGGYGIVSFLEEQRHCLPTSVYLHVNRGDEIDFRKLYGDWVAQCLARGTAVMDFAEFRRTASAWLRDHAAEAM